MPNPDPFGDVPVIGRLSAQQAGAKLREMDDPETADALEESA